MRKKSQEKRCPICSGIVKPRPGSVSEYYCTKCRRRVWKPEWAVKGFVEIGKPQKRKKKSKAWFEA